MEIDWATFINWMISGFIGLLFGIIGGWVKYRFDRQADDLKWHREVERERQRLESEWRHDFNILQTQLDQQFQQRMKELEIGYDREDKERLRNELLKDIDRATQAINELSAIKHMKVEERLEREIHRVDYERHLLRKDETTVDDELEQLRAELELGLDGLRAMKELRMMDSIEKRIQELEILRSYKIEAYEGAFTQHKKCSRCGNDNIAELYFCSRCGERMKT